MTPAIAEAISQWSDYLTMWAGRSPRAEIADRDGLHIAWASVPVPVYNAVLINEPVSGVDDLRARLRAAADLGAAKGEVMVICLCRDALPPAADAQLEELLAGISFAPSIPMTAMITEGPIEAASTDADLRTAAGTASQTDMMLLNCKAYDMPDEWAAGTIGAGVAPVDGIDYSVVAYRDGMPVSTATASIVDGRVYVSLVATHPEYRRKGYADAAMRQAIRLARDASGLQRVVLHATDAGRPVYERMGFVPTARYLGCFPVMAH